MDGVAEPGTDELEASIRPISNSRYSRGIPYEATVEIDDPPSGSALVSLTATPSSIAEGESATFTLTRTGGDTAQPLTVDIRVDDPQDFLRGNHWDPAPDIPTQVEFAANALTQTLTLTTPDDQRDLTDGDVKVWVLPGAGYLLAHTGLETSATVSVTDNDTPQVLSLEWGFLDYTDSSWEEGESWLDCTPRPCTYGPAEGIFYYEDNRTFRFFHNGLDEYFSAHFEVRRRPTDTGKTATFILRLEHDRGRTTPRHSDWPVDPVTGNHYQDFPLTLTGNQTNVVGRVEILDNGLVDPNRWEYSATIRNIEDAGGNALTPTEEAEYWTVTSPRKRTGRPFDRGPVQVA